MDPLVLPFAAYAAVTTFTPGPNNISSAAVGMRLGFVRTLPYIAGITAGFLVLMLAAGLLTDLASQVYRGILPWFRWIGAAYMVWLAVSLFLPTHRHTDEPQARNAGFRSGLLLQIVNPKVILYALTIYSAFHPLIAATPAALVLSSIGLALLGCASTSLWALLGHVFSRLLKGRVAMLVFNAVMSLLLVLSAVSLILH
jgi:cysteine/O-acetylserine efflux protein